MIYRKNSVIQKIKEIASPTEILNNVLTDSDIQFLYEAFLDAKSTPNLVSGRTREGMTKINNVYRVTDKYKSDIIKLIMSKANLNLNCKFENIQFYKIQRPYHLHTDTGLNNRIAYRQGIIPIDISPIDKNAYTVICNEKSYFSTELVHYLFKQDQDDDYKPFVNIPIREACFYEGWKDEYRIPDEICHILWKNKWEFWKEVYKGFSIDTLYKWKVGDIITFDRTRIHAASLMEEAGIDYKVGLLFLTTL